MSVRFLLLMRHASRAAVPTARTGTGTPSPDDAEKINEGQVHDVARGLITYIKETREAGNIALNLRLCLHPAEGPAEVTAACLKAALASKLSDLEFDSLKMVPEEDPLNPERKVANPYRGRSEKKEQNRQIEENCKLLNEILKRGNEVLKGAPPRNAILVIGHSPQVDWLLHQLVTPRRPRRWLPWHQYSFAAGEIVCVDLGKQWPTSDRHVIWSLLPSDKKSRNTNEKSEDLLREKIKGKMESAKLLGGIVGAGLAFVLAGFHDLALGWSSTIDDAAKELFSHAPKLDGERLIFFGRAFAALLLATGLFISAYLSYDSLLMPPRILGRN